MNRAEKMLTTVVLIVSSVIKVWSVVLLYTIYAHTEEIPHNDEYKAEAKRPKVLTHRPLR